MGKVPRRDALDIILAIHKERIANCRHEETVDVRTLCDPYPVWLCVGCGKYVTEGDE